MTRIIRSTVTSKGQITLPKAVRDHLHATQGTQLEFVLDGDSVTVRNSEPNLNAWQEWLGAVPLPDGQTVEDFMNDIRDRESRPPPIPNPPEQRIIYILPDGTETTRKP